MKSQNSGRSAPQCTSVTPACIPSPVEPSFQPDSLITYLEWAATYRGTAGEALRPCGQRTTRGGPAPGHDEGFFSSSRRRTFAEAPIQACFGWSIQVACQASFHRSAISLACISHPTLHCLLALDRLFQAATTTILVGNPASTTTKIWLV